MEPEKKSCNIGLVSDDFSFTETKPLDRLLARKLRGTQPQTSNNPGKNARKTISFSEYVHDVDIDAAVLTIRSAKFGRDRLVPLHGSTCAVLVDYMARRERHWQGRPVSSYLFVSSRGNRLDKADITRTFHKLSRQIGLRGKTDSHGPRLHDMRHSMATRALVNCYRHDQDPERLLPILSTWLGHVKVGDTQYYLEASPELMREAMRRLDSRWEDRS